MPTIQQEGSVRSVKGLPLRWGVKAYRELHAARGGVMFGELPERYVRLSTLLDEVVDAPLPLDATDSQICIKAMQWADECYRQTESIHDLAALRRRMQYLCEHKGIAAPEIESDRGFIARCCDPAWWRRQLRKIHGRKFEHAAIRLGFVSIRAGAYASDETVMRRIAQNKRNKKILESVLVENENGQSFSLADLAAKSTANKAIRRGELMLRMRGLEEIANELGHAGVFVTITCPSKYHAILARSGTTNPQYEGATPREAQAYLQSVWACIRAKCHRQGVRPYGFRIAEPHHDGCPHWHMLLFVARDGADSFCQIVREYALAEDGEEPGAKKNRVKIVRIEADKGTAAGYIAKYIGKNIDDEHVTDHIQQDGTVLESDLVGDEVIKPCQRVEAWAGQWGIRQFQSIGCPPITVWRELRRVQNETIMKAPSFVQDAFYAAQKIDGQKQADFAAYIRAQGGVMTGRKYRIGVATRVAEVEGRYGLSEAARPVGIYAKAQPNAVYESTRYRWSKVGKAAQPRCPWTRVNNCTVPAWTKDAPEPEPIDRFYDSAWFESADYHNLREIHERFYEF